MGKILCVWEMGGNLGHLTNLRLFVDEACSRGHDVTLCVKDLKNVATVFGKRELRVFQAPRLSSPANLSMRVSYSDMISGQLIRNAEDLSSLCQVWDSIFNAVNPDLVIYDHAPSALIASLQQTWQKWVIGSGFLVPRTDGKYLGEFPGSKKSGNEKIKLQSAEKSLLTAINIYLRGRGACSIKASKTIFTQCDQQLLLTLPELDHFGERKDGSYLGLKLSAYDCTPEWPAGSGPKIFVYMGNFLILPEVLRLLVQRDARIIFYGRDIPADVIKTYERSVSIVRRPVDLAKVFAQADYTVSHGGHGNASFAYIAGVPQLLLVTTQEQYFLAQRLEAMGRAVHGKISDKEILPLITALLKLRRVEPSPELGKFLDERFLPNRINNLLETNGF